MINEQDYDSMLGFRESLDTLLGKRPGGVAELRCVIVYGMSQPTFNSSTHPQKGNEIVKN